MTLPIEQTSTALTATEGQALELDTPKYLKGSWIRLGFAALFMILAGLLAALFAPNNTHPYLLMFAALVGAYMAMNIGANDVANNVGPAVGSGALTLVGAIILAAIFEASGALIAGGDVVSTIKSGIIDPSLVKDSQTFVWLMAGALFAGALWLNFATWMGAPVSTTHSIVGGILGAGLAAGGFEIANWSTLGAIVASWIVSPLMGGIIAAALLMFIKRAILYQSDLKTAAITYVPLLVALMAWAFTTYLLTKGIKNLLNVSTIAAYGTGLVVAAITYWLTRQRLIKRAPLLSNTIESVNSLFTVPLIFAAGLLSFAHGANDVANAIGPLAAISDALTTDGVSAKAPIPLWVMAIGALGLSVGLALFGPKLIRTVGGEITELDKSRAYCIAMSAAITVIIASQLGLPVSSTHIALGGIFGVGFLREQLKTRYASKLHRAVSHHEGEDRQRIEAFLRRIQTATVEETRAMLKKSSIDTTAVPITEKERKRLKKVYRQELVKRRHLYRIAAAWIITVPASAVLGALMFYMLRGMLL